MKLLAIFVCAGALLCAGCGKDEPAATGAPSGTAAAAKTPASAKPTAVASAAQPEPGSELDNEDIPVAEDYEQQAEKDITSDNLDQELDKIEKEMAQDKG
jgi:hypothetical protein